MFQVNKNLGILILRIGLGVCFLIHGYPKLTGGVEKWLELGKTMSFIGITFLPAFWGFMAAISEFLGGLLIATGVLFRPACILLSCTMVMAIILHINLKHDFTNLSHALECLIVFVSLFIMGAGKYRLFNNKSQDES